MPASPRLYIENRFAEQIELCLENTAAHYLFRVLRLAAGAPVRLFNGWEGEWLAKVINPDPKSGVLQVSHQLRPHYTPPDIRLLFAPLKKTRTDFLIEKTVELGVSQLIPIITEFTQTHKIRNDRLEKLIIEAAEQTERLDIPGIHPLQKLERILQDWPEDISVFYADESGDDPQGDWGGIQGRAEAFLSVLAQKNPRPTTPAAILIGPEGGFSLQERQWLRTFSFIHPINLGPRILRAETAAIVALTLWQAQNGDG